MISRVSGKSAITSLLNEVGTQTVGNREGNNRLGDVTS